MNITSRDVEERYHFCKRMNSVEDFVEMMGASDDWRQATLRYADSCTEFRDRFVLRDVGFIRVGVVDDWLSRYCTHQWLRRMAELGRVNELRVGRIHITRCEVCKGEWLSGNTLVINGDTMRLRQGHCASGHDLIDTLRHVHADLPSLIGLFRCAGVVCYKKGVAESWVSASY